MYKLLSILFLILIILGNTFCVHNADEPVKDISPSIKFVTGINFVCNNKTLHKNEQFNVCINASSNTNSNKPLNKLVITRSINSSSVIVVDSIFNNNEFSYVFIFNANISAGSETWLFKIYDSDNNTNEISFIITTVNYPPSISYVYNNIPYQVNQPFNIAISASCNTTTYKNLNRFVISKSFENSKSIILDSSIDVRNLNYFATYNTNSNPGTEKWTFIIFDKSGETDSASIDVFTGSFMTDEHYGIIWNSLGINNYGWDLINNTAKTQSDANINKDMANNTDQENSYPPYYFQNSFSSLNSTLYKKANWYDYENASVETIVDAYTGGTIGAMPKPTATGLTEGDIFIGKLRNTDNYTVIKITNVVWTVIDNYDKIEFSYKK